MQFPWLEIVKGEEMMILILLGLGLGAQSRHSSVRIFRKSGNQEGHQQLDVLASTDSLHDEEKQKKRGDEGYYIPRFGDGT